MRTAPRGGAPCHIHPSDWLSGWVSEPETVLQYADHVVGAAGGGGLRLTLPTPGHDAPSLEASIEFSHQETDSEDVPNYSAISWGMKLRF